MQHGFNHATLQTLNIAILHFHTCSQTIDDKKYLEKHISIWKLTKINYDLVMTMMLMQFGEERKVTLVTFLCGREKIIYHCSVSHMKYEVVFQETYWKNIF